MRKGSPHKCTKPTRNDNIVKIVRELSPASQWRVVGKLINDFCAEENVKKGGELKLLSGPKVMTITMGAQKKMRQLKIEDFFRFQSNENFSGRKTSAVASFLRKTCGTKIIEPGLEKMIPLRKEKLRPFFEVKNVELKRKNKKGDGELYQRPMVSCKPPVEAFVHHVKDERGMHEDNMELLMGIDDGQKSLKVIYFLNK